MVVMSSEQWREFNRNVIAEFRANGGRCGGPLEGNPLLLLTTTGARSGKPLTTPLTVHRDGEHLLVMASAGGAPKHPAWYHNLAANPKVTVEIDDRRFSANAREAEAGEEHARLFESFKAALPRFGGYQEMVERQIPIIVLEESR